MAGERLIEDTTLLDIHQAVQSNIPTRKNLALTREICLLRSRALGEITRPGDLLATHLIKYGRDLGQVMGFRADETELFTISFAQHLTEMTAKKMGQSDNQPPEVGMPFNTEGLSLDERSRVILWSQLLRKGGCELAKLFIEPTLPLKEAKTTLEEYTKLIGLARPPFVSYRINIHFKIDTALTTSEDDFKPDPSPVPIEEEDLTSIYQSVQTAIREIERVHMKYVEEVVCMGESYDLEPGEAAKRDHKKFNRALQVVNPAIKKLTIALGLNDFESFIFRKLFRFNIVCMHSNDFMSMLAQVSQGQEDTIKTELKGMDQFIMLEEMGLNSMLDELALRILLDDTGIDEAQMKAYISSLKNSAKLLAQIFYTDEQELGVIQTLLDQTAAEIRNLRIRHERFERVARKATKLKAI